MQNVNELFNLNNIIIRNLDAKIEHARNTIRHPQQYIFIHTRYIRQSLKRFSILLL